MTDDIVTRAIVGNWHSAKVVIPPDTPFTLQDAESYKPIADDIVERLRNSDGQGCTCQAYSYYECGCTEAVWSEMYIDEAANEIERLRKAGDELAACLLFWVMKYDADTDGTKALDNWKEVYRDSSI